MQTCLAALALSTAVNATGFKQPVLRVQAPVVMQDVLSLQPGDPIAQTPWPADLRGWVSAQNIRQLLQESERGIEAWSGTKRAWVEWCYPVTEGQLHLPLHQAITQHLQQQQLTLVRINELESATLPCLAAKPSSLTVTQVRMLNATRVNAHIALQMENGRQEKATLFVEIAVLVEGYRASGPIRKGALLANTRLAVDLFPWTGRELKAHPRLDQLRALKRLRHGHILETRDVEVLTDILLGDAVQVTVQHGGVSIQTSGRAITKANIGDPIRVQVEGSEHVAEGIVKDKGVVHVSV